MGPRPSFLALIAAIILALPLALGCGGLAASNVGEPTMQARMDFDFSLAQLHEGMPVDSLEILFEDVKKPGEAGILRRAVIVTEERKRVNFTLGWLSDPRHQIGHKEIEDLEVARAMVIVEDDIIRRIELRD